MRSRELAFLLACAAILLPADSARAATPVSSVSASPDVTVVLGSGTSAVIPDEGVAVDNLFGLVLPAPLGALAGAADVSGYELLPNGDQLLCFAGGAELPGPLVSRPGDVVRYDGATYAIAFDAAANGVPQGAGCDAVSVDATGRLVLSFDTGVALPGGIFAADEDLVRVDGAGTYAFFFDGSAAGIPEAADLDGVHLLPAPAGNIAVSLDVTISVGGITAPDEDVLEYDAGSGTWSLAYDASAQDPDWEAADADAIALPEPGGLLLASGIGLLLLLRSRRARLGGSTLPGPHRDVGAATQARRAAPQRPSGRPFRTHS